jgi:radical SAM superfamily enzyme YgiQ (UPF0313 family)
MNIGLLDIDGHNFPNLALMKISAWHKQQGHGVEFADMFGDYDILYKSKIFSWTTDPEYIYNTNKIIKGGTGFDYSIKLPEEIDQACPDYELYNCQHAYGFLTRGCVRNCSWCIVPRKEGSIKVYSDIDDFIADKKNVIIMDNNILAHDHGLSQIEKMAKMGLKVDFNQGLDSRLIDIGVAKLLSKIKFLYPLRMSCDTDEQLNNIKKAIKILRKYNVTPKRYFVYVLVKDLGSALERVMKLKELNLTPFAQPYRDLENNEPSIELKRFARWVNRKAIFNSVSWKDYK